MGDRLPFRVTADFLGAMLDATGYSRKYFGADGEAFELVEYGSTVTSSDGYATGEQREYVIKHLESGCFFKAESQWDSWGGESGLNDGSFREVRPVQKTVTIYE